MAASAHHFQLSSISPSLCHKSSFLSATSFSQKKATAQQHYMIWKASSEWRKGFYFLFSGPHASTRTPQTGLHNFSQNHLTRRMIYAMAVLKNSALLIINRKEPIQRKHRSGGLQLKKLKRNAKKAIPQSSMFPICNIPALLDAAALNRVPLSPSLSPQGCCQVLCQESRPHLHFS